MTSDIWEVTGGVGEVPLVKYIQAYNGQWEIISNRKCYPSQTFDNAVELWIGPYIKSNPLPIKSTNKVKPNLKLIK